MTDVSWHRYPLPGHTAAAVVNHHGDISQIRPLFHSHLLYVGQFRCRPAGFRYPGRAGGHLMAFPRTSLTITHEGGRPIVADPNMVMFYNRDQRFSRDPISPEGDVCEFFVLPDAVVTNVVRAYDPAVNDRPQRPFDLSHGPSRSTGYLAQRMVVDHLRTAEQIDRFYVEETMLMVLAEVVDASYLARGWRPEHRRISITTKNEHRELARAAQAILDTRFRQAPSLTDLAAELFVSPYHLCRVFRKETGYTINHYLQQLRLRVALDHIDENNTDLARLALDLGYAGHSHFTRNFRRAFGLTPSQWREKPHLRRLPAQLPK